MDPWRHKEPFKGPVPFTYSHLPWALAKVGQTGLEMPQEKLVTETLGRELSRCWDLGAESSPIQQQPSLLRQTTPVSGSILRGNNSPDPGRDSANSMVCKPDC